MTTDAHPMDGAGAAADEAADAIVIASCGGLRIGVPVAAVERIVAAPLPVPLAGAPAVVAGIVDRGGAPLVVVDLARRDPAEARARALDDRLIIVTTPHRSVGLLCQAVEGPRPLPERLRHGVADLVPGAAYLVATGGDQGLILIHDPARLLGQSEELDLAAALARRRAEAAP